MSVSIEEDSHFRQILEFLLQAKGFDGHQYKGTYIKRRVAVRMRATHTTTYGDYLKVLQTHPQECSLLLDRLTIHVTEFFRDPEVYGAVQDKILPALNNVEEGRARIWCAGCSTGEEPYSVGILLKEWASRKTGLSFEILATDIDAPSVQTAERGVYLVQALAKLPEDRVRTWFKKEGEKVSVSAELRKAVRFKTHDLMGEWGRGFSDFNVIFCRNILIYLTGVQQQKIYERFARALAPGGFLVLGLTETLLGQARSFYHCVDVKHRIYQVKALRPTAEDDKRTA